MYTEMHSYLISYDISDARRLRRLHRRVQAEAMPLLESLYLVHATPAHIERLWLQLQKMTDPHKDRLQFLRLDTRFPLILAGTAIPSENLIRLGGPAWCTASTFLQAQKSP